MIIRPNLTKTEILAKITEIETKLDNSVEVGDEISSMGATVKYNHKTNYYKQQLEELNKMLASKIIRGE